MKQSPIKIPVYQPSLNGNEKLYVLECLETNWISSKGRFNQEFEKRFSDFTHLPFSTTVCNATVGLHLALVALEIEPGDEIIVPTFTYIASVNAIHYVGAKPIFVDSLESSWQMNPEEIRKAITPKTQAIMVVHLYGQACDMDAIVAIAKEHDLLVIEDCAEALGTYYKKKHVGVFGDAAVFSFFGNKTITTGEGGIVATDSEKLYEKFVHRKGQGLAKDREYWHDVIGYNYRMTNICAAIGLAQLEQVETFLTQKREIATWYQEELPEITFHREMEKTTHSYWMCSILVDEREGLRKWLRKEGIETRPAFPLIHKMPMYFSEQRFPIAESLSLKGVNLPSWPGLTRDEIKHICEQINQWRKCTSMGAAGIAEALPMSYS